jgi:hypothetical protein
MQTLKILAALAVAAFAQCEAIAAGAFGAHLFSKHTAGRPDDRQPGWSVRGEERPRYNESNIGLYVRTDDGMTAGFYHNSYEKWSLYVGRQWDATLPHDWQVSIEPALVTGYPKGQFKVGNVTFRIGAVPSVATPPLPLIGARLRLGYLPDFEKRGGKRSLRDGVFHLMVERAF